MTWDYRSFSVFPADAAGQSGDSSQFQFGPLVGGMVAVIAMVVIVVGVVIVISFLLRHKWKKKEIVTKK